MNCSYVYELPSRAIRLSGACIAGGCVASHLDQSITNGLDKLEPKLATNMVSCVCS